MKVIYNEECLEIPEETARDLAGKNNLDLVQISKDTYKIMDYGKYLYEQKKKKKENAKNEIETKEVQISLHVDEADRKRKLESACKWLNEGKNVRVVIRARGREKSFNDIIKATADGITETITSGAAVREVKVNPNNNMIITYKADTGHGRS